MTNTELAILSLVGEAPRHGYEIEQTIEARGMRDWTEIGFSSIYYLLNKLEKGGLIKSALQAPKGRGPARKVYTITSKGRQVHIDETTKSLSIPQTRSSSFLLGLSNIFLLSKNQQLSSLRNFVSCLEERLEHLDERVVEQSPLPDFVETMFDYSQNMIEAELNWVTSLINKMEDGDVKNRF